MSPFLSEIFCRPLDVEDLWGEIQNFPLCRSRRSSVKTGSLDSIRGVKTGNFDDKDLDSDMNVITW